MTLEEAKKIGLLLFDVEGLTPFIRAKGNDWHEIEFIFEGKRYSIKHLR